MTFLTQKTFSRLQLSCWLQVEKFEFIAKGLVDDFDQKFEVLFILNFLGQIDQKECLAMSLIENELS